MTASLLYFVSASRRSSPSTSPSWSPPLSLSLDPAIYDRQRRKAVVQVPNRAASHIQAAGPRASLLHQSHHQLEHQPAGQQPPPPLKPCLEHQHRHCPHHQSTLLITESAAVVPLRVMPCLVMRDAWGRIRRDTTHHPMVVWSGPRGMYRSTRALTTHHHHHHHRAATTHLSSMR